MHTVRVTVTDDLVKESMHILHKYAEVIKREVERRFKNVDITADAVNLFSIEHQPDRDQDPKQSLARIPAWGPILFKHVDV